jgi:hypothetical protein
LGAVAFIGATALVAYNISSAPGPALSYLTGRFRFLGYAKGPADKAPREGVLEMCTCIRAIHGHYALKHPLREGYHECTVFGLGATTANANQYQFVVQSTDGRVQVSKQVREVTIRGMPLGIALWGYALAMRTLKGVVTKLKERPPAEKDFPSILAAALCCIDNEQERDYFQRVQDGIKHGTVCQPTAGSVTVDTEIGAQMHSRNKLEDQDWSSTRRDFLKDVQPIGPEAYPLYSTAGIIMYNVLNLVFGAQATDRDFVESTANPIWNEYVATMFNDIAYIRDLRAFVTRVRFTKDVGKFKVQTGTRVLQKRFDDFVNKYLVIDSKMYNKCTREVHDLLRQEEISTVAV